MAISLGEAENFGGEKKKVAEYNVGEKNPVGGKTALQNWGPAKSETGAQVKQARKPRAIELPCSVICDFLRMNVTGAAAHVMGYWVIEACAA